MKRTTGIVAALAAVGLTLTGCSTAASQNRDSAATLVTKTAEAYPTGPVHLVMWWWGKQEAPGAKKWLADTVAGYQQKHPNVTIDTVLQTTDRLIPAFQAAASAKQGPDIEYFWGGIYFQQPAWSGQIQPVSDYIAPEESPWPRWLS